MELKRISENVLYIYNWEVNYIILPKPREYPYLCLPMPDFKIIINTVSSGIIFK